ncbi:MAG TPA: AAA family ATPase [Acidimicrobiales bacterium]|nr:AAA family ATPase [Acidimicrobiales bacterium]
MKVLATYNLKGGVGKTSAAVNMASLSAMDGLATLIWDLDPQGSATFLFRVRPKVRGGARKLVRGRSEVAELLRGTDVPGLDLLPADFSYRHLDLVLDDTKNPTARLRRVLAPLEQDYEVAVLDCPPSISLVSESVFEGADALLVPLVPTSLAVRSFEQLVDFVSSRVDHPPAILAFLSMVDRRKRLHCQLAEELPERHPSILRTAIPSMTDIERMGVLRQPLPLASPAGAATRAYAALWAEVTARLRLGPGVTDG